MKSAVRLTSGWALAAFALVSVSSLVLADAWPSRTIRIVVPLAAGSAIDIVPRTIFDEVSKDLGQTVIVDNRPGAGTLIGSNDVAKADPDGYTLLSTSAALTIVQTITARPPFDAARDFAGISIYGIMPNVLVVAPSRGLKSVGDLVKLGKAKPGALNYGSAGAGTPGFFNTVRFLAATGVEAQNIPFKGAPEALTEVMTGRVDFYFVPLLPALPLIKSGQLQALAVSSSKRVAVLPDVPTTEEAGFANSAYDFWVGLLAPAKTDAAIVNRLHEAVAKAIAQPSVSDKLKNFGVEPVAATPAEFDRRLKDELASTAVLAKAAGVVPQ